jgi:putative ABC transport system substrate-binding protein
VNRRQLLVVLAGMASARARTAHSAEQIRRIGVLAPYIGSLAEPRIAAFRTALAQLGWSEGRNLKIDYRWNERNEELSQDRVRELMALTPEVIVSQTSQALQLLSAIDRTLPVVVANAADLVELGIIDSLAHPGGNVTGFTLPEFSIAGKWLELLRAIAPGIRRVLNIYYYPASSLGHRDPHMGFVAATRAGAAPFGIEVVEAPVRNGSDIADAIEAFARAPNGGLIIHSHATISEHRQRIIALAASHALPAIYPYRHYVEQGGLMCYGINLVERWRSVAGYVDLILRGARAGDLPVQSTSRIELVINLKTATTLGLTVPPRLLAGADTVIQ